MGSRMMHVMIALRTAERLAIEDRALFVLGNIAPDAVSPKDASHFFTGDVRDYSRSVDYNGFIYKYDSYAESPYIWGYFTHLLADHVWLKGFYLPWLRNRIEANQDVLHVYHNDFRLLNGKLLTYYGYQDELRSLFRELPSMMDLHEVKSVDVQNLIPHVLSDMDYDEKVEDEKLNVFTFEQIVGYLETSVDLGIWHLKRLLTSR
ncbi:zinc dependent phospholipase C family protein [Bacillus sp. 3255]|uniref:zinc dependent phospholipase C family protein n=1 Tax=Bacillus sp. 3255 TaxID=2817904 RepID=UPI0028611F6D|nr:zinc dependent phospholipase C family protein [Bacillus sp. 3255]MDR6879982.1 hypothetical protein [Bacillus sp. 3255]